MLNPKHIGKLALAGALVAGVALAGCAAGNSGTADTTDTDTTVTEDVTTDDTEATTDGTEEEEGVVTEWTVAKTAEDAVKGASLTGEFAVPEKATAHEIEFSAPTFSYTDGIVQATYDQPASQLLIRKGVGPSGTVVADDDTGFAGSNFAESWQISPGGLIITCYGNTKGEVIFAEWYNKVDPSADGQDDAYSIHALGLGGGDIPMTEEEVGNIALEVK